MIANLAKQVSTIFHSSKFPTWAIFIFFYCALVFVSNNKHMGALIVITTGLLAYKTKNAMIALYLTALLCLPFTKGKGFQFELLSAAQTKFHIPYTFDFDVTFWGVCLLLFAYVTIRNRRSILLVHITHADIYVVLFLLACIPSTLFASYPHIAVLGFLELSHVVLLYLATRLMLPKIHINLTFIILAIQLSFEGIIATLQFMLRRPLGLSIESSGGQLLQSDSIEYAFEQVGFFRARGTFDHSNTLGTFASSLVPIFIMLLLYKKNSPPERIIYSTSAALGTAGIIVSGSRTSIAIFLLFLCTLFFIRKKQNKPFFPWGPTTLRVALLMGTFACVTIIIPRMAQLASTLQDGGGLTYRITLLELASAIAQNNFFGVGLGLFPKEVFTNIGTFTSYPAQPHNLLAQIASEGGVLACVFFLLFLIQKFAGAWPVVKKGRNARALAIITSMVILLTLSQVYPFLLRSSIFPYVLLLLAILP
jgi:O-antigen ligase